MLSCWNGELGIVKNSAALAAVKLLQEQKDEFKRLVMGSSKKCSRVP
jgi:hypothetical protein